MKQLYFPVDQLGQDGRLHFRGFIQAEDIYMAQAKLADLDLPDVKLYKCALK